MNIHEAARKLESGEITPEQYADAIKSIPCIECGQSQFLLYGNSWDNDVLVCSKCTASTELETSTEAVSSHEYKGSDLQGVEEGGTPEVSNATRGEGFNARKK